MWTVTRHPFPRNPVATSVILSRFGFDNGLHQVESWVTKIQHVPIESLRCVPLWLVFICFLGDCKQCINECIGLGTCGKKVKEGFGGLVIQ